MVVVEHNLACMDFLLLVYLPEDGGLGPVIAGADSVAHHLLHRFSEVEVFTQLQIKGFVATDGCPSV